MTNTTRRKFLLGAAPVAAAAAPTPTHEPLDSEKFRAAVLAGDSETTSRYLERDPALAYSRDAQGNSVYTLASLAGHAKVAEVLASRGLILDIFEAAASGNLKRAAELVKTTPGLVHARSADGRTPLHFAAAAGRPAMVMFLNAQGADLSAGPEGPASVAADYSDIEVATEMAQTLLGNASDPNARRKDGNTALHLAAARGNPDVVRMLIHRGADVDARNADGKTSLDVATGEAVKVLRNASSIERVYFAARNRGEANGLPQDFINQFVTVAHFDFDRVKQMLKLCPALLNTRATWDELAVEAAAHMGLVPMAQHLSELGSPVSVCTATMLGQAEIVGSMIHADPNRLRERGAHDFPLLSYTAFGEERLEIAELLLQSGASLNPNVPGQTPLHVAASKGYIELAKLFLAHGADVNAESRSRGGVTPLAVALRAKQSKMAEFLKQHGGRGPSKHTE